MWRKFAAAIALGFLAMGLANAEPQPFPDRVPVKMKIYIGGFLGTRNSIELDNGVIHFQQFSGRTLKKDISIRPDSGAWSKFIEAINKAKLYRWAPNYPSYGVMDGTQWSVDLEFADRKIGSAGDNNYPTEGNEAEPNKKPEPTAPFVTFCHALSQLLGEEVN